MNSLIDKVLDEGNCGEVTNRGEEACEDERKRRVCISPPGLLHVKAARLRTETSYKAGSTRRVSPSSRSRDQSVVQVNDELVQRSITFLSGEIQLAYLGVGLARKPEPCMRKQLGANWKSAAGIVVDHFGRRRPKGNEQVRATISSRGDTLECHSPTRRNKPRGATSCSMAWTFPFG